MTKLKQIFDITRRYGLKVTLTTFKEHFLYNFAGIYMKRYDPQNFLSSPHEPDDVYYVSPERIEYFQPSLFSRFVPGFDQSLYPTPIVPGYWDRLKVSITNRIFYRSLEEHFQSGVPWEDTMYVQQCIKDVKAGNSSWHGAQSVDEIFERCNQVDLLYKSIRNCGFKSQKELNSDEPEITVNVGKNGELIQSAGGKHRITIAKLLGLSQIPIRIYVTHTNWQSTEEVTEYFR